MVKMPIELRKAKFEHSGPFWQEGNNFFFTATSITEDFACKYVMEILAEQSPNNALVFRHRHPAGREDKVVPIFGRVHESKVVEQNDIHKMETTYRVPIKAPNGKDIKDNVAFAEWVKKSYEEGNPIAISLQFSINLDEDGKAYMANIIEHTGTHYPACKSCVNSLPTEVVAMEEKVEMPSVDAIKAMDSKQLEELLEARTLEREKLEQKVVALEKEIGEIKESNGDLKATLEEEKTASVLLEKLSKDFTVLNKKFETLDALYKYETSEEKKVIDKIIELEGEPDFEEVYRKWNLEKLNAHLKKWEDRVKPGLQAAPLDPGQRMRAYAKKRLEDSADPSTEEILANVDPSIREELGAFLNKKGGA